LWQRRRRQRSCAISHTSNGCGGCDVWCSGGGTRVGPRTQQQQQQQRHQQSSCSSSRATDEAGKDWCRSAAGHKTLPRQQEDQRREELRKLAQYLLKTRTCLRGAEYLSSLANSGQTPSLVVPLLFLRRSPDLRPPQVPTEVVFPEPVAPHEIDVTFSRKRANGVSNIKGSASGARQT
jgi:hypothetical protein